MGKYCRARVLSVDYRLAPEYTFPIPLNDVISAYLSLIQPPADSGEPAYRPEQIIFMGDSAGGGLALACALWLRDDSRFPMPGGLVLFSPWLDLTHSLPSWRLNNPFDYLPDASTDPKHITTTRSHYYISHNQDLKNPYVSPLFATTHHKHPLPPILIQCGDAEKLRDESIVFTTDVMKHQQNVQLELYEDMVHVFQMWAGVEAIAKYALKRAGAWVLRLGGEGEDGEVLEVPDSPKAVTEDMGGTLPSNGNGYVVGAEALNLWANERVVRILKPERNGKLGVFPVKHPMRIVDEAREILVARGQWEGTKKGGRPALSRGASHFVTPTFVMNQDQSVKEELDKLAIQVNPEVNKEEHSDSSDLDM
ncbi:hypothetical protein HK097_007494 [Rhizophlyctis rosea]|uniref:Alpha/beta hydrolase fold-3 domain-containing protein n=1 Tax=Rhizophlyctis rosea TaxID=64517 RepID=A0AAD5SJV3_9FUNG|nr:hypothetical protein HK097_007494 [Rhizophlyctis rosea]